MKINNIELTRLMTTEEVAEYFKVTSNCITQNFIKRGLKYIKVGTKCYRYNIKDVLEFEDKIKVDVLAEEGSGEDLANAFPHAIIEVLGTKKVYRR